eukprot:Skav233480  [mRNA]  locus=scaffold1310:56392:61546:+ [translate_table: standard]
MASDKLGHFSCVNLTWSVVGQRRGVLIHTSFKTYPDSCAIIFTQEVPYGAQGTNASKAEMPKDGHKVEEGAFPPILSFPSFLLSERLQNLGYLTWKGTFAQAIYGKNVTEHLAGLSSNGPVVLFDQTSSLIVSPLDNFKTAVHTHSVEANAWETGVSSELTSIPSGFSHRTLIIAGVGITQAIDAYGKTVRKIYSTDRSQEKLDPVINYLSYWTAAGLPNLKFLPRVDRWKDFKFVLGSHGSTEFAVPDPDFALAFYRMLFDYGIANGMRGFEHDFLNFNFLAVPHFRQNFGSSRRWLQAMDQAAFERALPVQLCMALPSIADKAGDSNATLLLRSMRSDGLILQPDKPATSIDASFMTALEGRKLLQGNIWSTYAEVDEVDGVNVRSRASRLLWHYVLSIDVHASWHLQKGDFYPALDMKLGWVAHRWHRLHAPTPCLPGQLAVKSGCLLGPGAFIESDLPRVLNDRPVMVANDTHQFDLLQLSPVLANGWVLLGETTKYVSVSRKRFRSVTVTSAGISVEADGVINEEIHVVALKPTEISDISPGREWTIIQKTVRFESSSSVVVHFTPEKVLEHAMQA